MTQENALKQAEDKTKYQQFFAWFTLLPFPIVTLLALLFVGVAYLIGDNPSESVQGIGLIFAWTVVPICFVSYPAIALLSLIGVVLSFTLWKNARTRFLTALMWLNTIILVLNAGYLIYLILTSLRSSA